MTRIILIFLAFMAMSLKGNDPALNREEAQSAFNFLNRVRTDPQAHEKEYKFLEDVKAMPALRWNDTLARVAEARALDMAKKNYFGHVDPDGYGVNYHMNKAGYSLPAEWLKDRGANYFESLGAGASSGINAIENLIIDANTPSLGHRRHLLGMTDWDASLVDIGIGYVTSDNSKFSSYACVIIAKHNW